MPETAARVHTLTIPGWRPALLNELRSHPMRAARLKKRDARIVAAMGLVVAIPRVAVPRAEAKQRRALGVAARLANDPAPLRRRVGLEITGRYGRFPDPDSPWKSLLDALVTVGLLVDDSARWCELTAPAFRRGPLGTVITLEDLPR